uniref:Active regulator of SIRT1 n=1 Tax=Colobus angolensis palliatus TaxID=336983 RepID=A0A2K5JP93_COLAP
MQPPLLNRTVFDTTSYGAEEPEKKAAAEVETATDQGATLKPPQTWSLLSVTLSCPDLSSTGVPSLCLRIDGGAPTDEYRKRECRDHLRVNLKFLTRTRSTVAESVSQQILRQNRGRKACDRPVAKTKKKKKAEGTVFTEEDFQKFQQEYFGS